MIKFNASKLAAVAIANATEETSRYFYGVYFYGKYAVTTDGNMITIAYDPDSVIEEAGLYPISPLAVKAMCDKTATDVIIGRGELVVCNDDCYAERCNKISWAFFKNSDDTPSDHGRPTLAWMTNDIMECVCKTTKLLSEAHQLATAE